MNQRAIDEIKEAIKLFYKQNNGDWSGYSTYLHGSIIIDMVPDSKQYKEYLELLESNPKASISNTMVAFEFSLLEESMNKITFEQYYKLKEQIAKEILKILLRHQLAGIIFIKRHVESGVYQTKLQILDSVTIIPYVW